MTDGFRGRGRNCRPWPAVPSPANPLNRANHNTNPPPPQASGRIVGLLVRARYDTSESGSAKGAHHTSPAQRAGKSDGRGQSAESAFHFNPRHNARGIWSHALAARAGILLENCAEWFAGTMWNEPPVSLGVRAVSPGRHAARPP